MDRLIERTLAATRDLRERALDFEAEHAGEDRRGRAPLSRERAQPAALPERAAAGHPDAATGPAFAWAVIARRARITRDREPERRDRQPGKTGRQRDRRQADAAGGRSNRPVVAAGSRADAARADTAIPFGQDHGDDAVGGCERRAAAGRPAARRHGCNAYQLRPRRPRHVAAHGGQPAQGRAHRGSQVQDPGGSCRAEASHRLDRACRSFRAHPATSRRDGQGNAAPPSPG